MQPLLDALQPPAGFDPLTQHRSQPVMRYRLEKSAAVTVEHLSHPAAKHALPDRMQGLRWTVTRGGNRTSG